MDVTKRRWDHTLGVWVLDTTPEKPVETPPKPNLFYDLQTGQWVEESAYYAAHPPPEKPQDFTASSCEIPPDYWTKEKEKNRKDLSKTTSYYNNWTPCYPWEGVDRKRFPKTWWTLFQMYHSNDWYKGQWVDERTWRDRLKGVYNKIPWVSNYARTQSQSHYYHHPYEYGDD